MQPSLLRLLAGLLEGSGRVEEVLRLAERDATAAPTEGVGSARGDSPRPGCRGAFGSRRSGGVGRTRTPPRVRCRAAASTGQRERVVAVLDLLAAGAYCRVLSRFEIGCGLCDAKPSFLAGAASCCIHQLWKGRRIIRCTQG